MIEAEFPEPPLQSALMNYSLDSSLAKKNSREAFKSDVSEIYKKHNRVEVK